MCGLRKQTNSSDKYLLFSYTWNVFSKNDACISENKSFIFSKANYMSTSEPSKDQKGGKKCLQLIN